MSVAPSRWVVIDDIDSSITYTGPWFEAPANSLNSLGNFGPTYLDTSHGTNGIASFSYRFQGSAVNVFGTTNITNSSAITDPSWGCFIDGFSIGTTIPVQYPENNWLLCTWNNNGTSGSHVLTVNATSTGHSFWFDWLKYKPAPTALLRNAVVYLDRQDTAIKYDPSWQALGVTTNMTSTNGSTVTLDFIGTQLTWYGFIPTELPHNPSLATYAIDGQTVPTTFTLKGLATADSVTTYHQQFFQTPVLLSSGPHELVVTFNGDVSSSPLTISYILVQNGSLSAFAPYNSSTGISSPPSPSPSPSSPTSPFHDALPGVVVVVVFVSLSILWATYVIKSKGRLISPDVKPAIDRLIRPYPPPLNNGYSRSNNSPGSPTLQPSLQLYDHSSDAATFSGCSSSPVSNSSSRLAHYQRQLVASTSRNRREAVSSTTSQMSSSSADIPVRGSSSEGTSGSESKVNLSQVRGPQPLYTPGQEVLDRPI